jgi:hypothetical protein
MTAAMGLTVLAQLLPALHAVAASIGAQYPTLLVDLFNVPSELIASAEAFVAQMALALIGRHRRTS